MRDRVLLVSMPWALSYMASIQVGSLKAFLQLNGIDCVGAHWFLDIANALGHETYSELCYPHLSDGEALYAYLLFPEKRAGLLIDRPLQKKFSERRPLQSRTATLTLDLSESFFKAFEAVHQRILDRYDWSKILLAGFTLNFGQTLGSIYMAREIKRRSPETSIIIGGSEASGELGKSLLECFSCLDFACNGEGEQPLLDLYRALRTGRSSTPVRGITARTEAGQVVVQPPNQMSRLELPTPDFDEYFATIEASGLDRSSISACLPIESSRGCYFACTFCALNLQWSKFRAQDRNRVAATLSELSSKYQLLDFFFVDNIAPANAGSIFENVEQLGLDLRFFYEIRVDTKYDTLVQMKRAGLTRVQLGIEALSTALLNKFAKRARVIDNLQGMKFCEELELLTCGNLIVNHPKGALVDVEESVSNIEFCTAYRPPNAFAPFDLEYGAPDYDHLSPVWIEIEGNHPEYARIFPDDILPRLSLLRKAFKARNAPVDWTPLYGTVERWRQTYQSNNERFGAHTRHLAQFDGGSFLRIEDRRSGSLQTYTLEGVYRRLYLGANHITCMDRLAEIVSDRLCQKGLEAAVNELVRLRLMFREGDDCLSLAMHPSSAKKLGNQRKPVALRRSQPRLELEIQ